MSLLKLHLQQIVSDLYVLVIVMDLLLLMHQEGLVGLPIPGMIQVYKQRIQQVGFVQEITRSSSLMAMAVKILLM